MSKFEYDNNDFVNMMDIKNILREALKKVKEESILEGKTEDAKIMKKKGFTVDDISEITGLSVKVIKNL
jgi:predicted transposase/invertase (TIGR01784 family)